MAEPRAAVDESRSPAGFRHEALLYDGMSGLAAATVDFVDEGLAAGESVVLALPPPSMRAVVPALGRRVHDVALIDLADLGANPARIIPVWREHLEKALDEGRGIRGIGQPIWPERTATQLEEALLHEALLNTAFDDGPSWRLACPYDTRTIDDALLAGVLATHPWTTDTTGTVANPDYLGSATARERHALPLSPAPDPVLEELDVDAESLPLVRAVVGQRAASEGMPLARVQELVLAVHELATNSVRHGGGSGRLRMWAEGADLVAEVRDRGVIGDPLAGRRQPGEGLDGRGLWMVNQLCDLLQLRSTAEGTVARIRMAVAG